MEQQQHSKVERFIKLGYSHGDILRVLDSLDHDAQTNDILEELIKTGHRSSNRSASMGSQPSPKLVPRGCGPLPTSSNSSPKLSPSRPDPAADRDSSAGFKPVVIDGSNVAMSHGDKKVFSCKGLQLAVKWFWDKGVRDVTVFVPLWRKEQPRPEAPITDQHVLHELERRKILVYTPSRCVNGRRVVCYDDRYIVKLAYDLDGIIVSNDNYRDLQTESPQWKKFIEERLLMYTFANDKFMPPDDPLGRNGPTIDDFLRNKPWSVDNKLQHCPYGKKCTYGVKCKFYHPERANQSQLSVADELRAMSRPAAERAKPGFSTSTKAPGQVVDQDASRVSPAPYHDLERTVSHPHTYLPSNPTPPPLGKDDQSHRASPIEQFVCPRDTGSPGTPQWNPGYRLCPSPDVDEAFGSLDSYLSRMHIQDATKSSERLPSYGYSSGVASLVQGSENYFPSGTYGSNTERQGGYPSSTDGYYTPQRALQNGCDHHSHTCDHHHSTCGPCRYAHQHTHSPRFIQHPPRGSCPSLHPHSSENRAISPNNQHFPSIITKRQSHSLPEEHWGQGGARDAGLTRGQNQTPSSEQRKNLRSQLSTLFPQSVVDHIMALYPHVVDVSQLITLIQRYRAGQNQFTF